MDIKSKMNTKFRDLQGGLFLTVTKADVGEGAGNFQKNGATHYTVWEYNPAQRTWRNTRDRFGKLIF